MTHSSPEIASALAGKVERISHMMTKLMSHLPFCDPDIKDLEEAAAFLRAVAQPARLTPQELHAINHARYQVDHSTPENPDCCFDYELVRDLVSICERYRSSAQPQPLIGPGNPAFEETRAAVTAAREKGYAAARENLKEAWAALVMIRETIETLAPSGSVKAAEHLDGPTFMHEAEALVAGLMAMSAQPQPAGERCPSCFGTDEDYRRGLYKCSDPWHADDHLRAKTLAQRTTTSVLPRSEGQGLECDGGLHTQPQTPPTPKTIAEQLINEHFALAHTDLIGDEEYRSGYIKGIHDFLSALSRQEGK